MKRKRIRIDDVYAKQAGVEGFYKVLRRATNQDVCSYAILTGRYTVKSNGVLLPEMSKVYKCTEDDIRRELGELNADSIRVILSEQTSAHFRYNIDRFFFRNEKELSELCPDLIKIKNLMKSLCNEETLDNENKNTNPEVNPIQPNVLNQKKRKEPEPTAVPLTTHLMRNDQKQNLSSLFQNLVDLESKNLFTLFRTQLTLSKILMHPDFRFSSQDSSTNNQVTNDQKEDLSSLFGELKTNTNSNFIYISDLRTRLLMVLSHPDFYFSTNDLTKIADLGRINLTILSLINSTLKMIFAYLDFRASNQTAEILDSPKVLEKNMILVQTANLTGYYDTLFRHQHGNRGNPDYSSIPQVSSTSTTLFGSR